jgi:hypothetical protein
LSEHITSDEPYLLVEEVAERLGLPLSVLLHRVEAGDIPARRVERADGLHYALRLGDLGIELDDRGLRSAAIDDDAAAPGEETLSAAFEPTDPTVESAIFSAFDSGPAPVPGTANGNVDATAHQVDDDDDNRATREAAASAWSHEDADVLPWQPSTEAAPPWALRPREPQEPPVWLTPGRGAGSEASADAEAGTDAVETFHVEEDVPGSDDVGVIEEIDQYVPPPFVRGDAAAGGVSAVAPTDFRGEADDRATDQDTAVAELAVPPPSREPPMNLVDAAASGPRGDLASMSLDARELVAGLLDRWERTLEQRIYTEQRQRFQAELVARQNMVKQLQMELHTARAEHAAAQAEKDRVLAGKERELADRERDLADTRRVAQEAERMIAPAASRRRRWFWNRDD